MMPERQHVGGKWRGHGAKSWMCSISSVFDIEAVRESRGFNEESSTVLRPGCVHALPAHTASFPLRPFHDFFTIIPFRLLPLSFSLSPRSYFPRSLPTSLYPRVPTRLTPPYLVVISIPFASCHGSPYPGIAPVAVLLDITGHK
jgi:hypothetical protein